MKHPSLISVVFPAALFIAGISSTSAFADNCTTFNQNPLWNANLTNLQTQLEDHNYEAALESSKALFEICPRSPIVNYYTSIALREMGEKSKALTLLQKASEYTTEFSTSPEISQLIWYARFEAENPDRSEDAMTENKRKMLELEKMAEAYKMSNVELDTRLSSNETLQNVVRINERELSKEKFAAIMWTGTAIGTLGIASTITGAVLAFTLSNDEKYEWVNKIETQAPDQNHYIYKFKIRPKYSAGLGLFGGGLALTVAGAVMTGFGAYNYVRISDDIAFSFDIAPSYTGISMTF